MKTKLTLHKDITYLFAKLNNVLTLCISDMADNSKYITQLRRETSRTSFKSTSPKATITRHATSWALSKKAMDAAASHESPPLRSKPSQVTANVFIHALSTSNSLLYHLCQSKSSIHLRTTMVQLDTMNFTDSSPCSIVQ